MALSNHRASNHIICLVVVSELIIWLWILAIATMAIFGGEPPPDPNYSNMTGSMPSTEFTSNRILNRCIDFAALVSLVIWNGAIRRHNLLASRFIIARVVSLWMAFITSGAYWILVNAPWR